MYDPRSDCDARERDGNSRERKRFDFFVRQLLGVTPPSWNVAAPADRQPGRTSAN
jgi:hypothetical protein